MDTFRILMVLPSVFTRGWDHFGRKIGPPGGGPETPFLGSGGYPPTAPPPPPRGGGNPGQKGPPPGVPLFCNQIRVKKLREGKRVIDFLHTLPYLVSVDYYVENYTYHSDVFSSSSFIFLSSEISD